ncbi:hypothetical protein [Nigerium massiliense]|uniref:hypothetical protein n=1 Tax=Nigerium massiliense TaxID=1522317 RepID=UPI001C458CA3|nr:hypothetical protein [Nigerium massiliense]
MKNVILGATGMAGTAITDVAALRGARRPGRLTSPPAARQPAGDPHRGGRQ